MTCCFATANHYCPSRAELLHNAEKENPLRRLSLWERGASIYRGGVGLLNRKVDTPSTTLKLR
jgi:hypothetical protein